MSGASPNISLNSFSFAKYYDGLSLQMGVPVLDSDWNELSDIRRIQSIVDNLVSVGSAKLGTDYTGSQPYGFDLYQSSPSTNNFGIRAGWAMVQGVLVPTTSSSPPSAVNYSSQVMFTGTVSLVGGPATYVTDSSKAFSADHNLVGCRLIPTSGPEIGNTFVISGLVGSTQLTLTGGTGGILAGNTYEIRPPALTTPGSARTDVVYIQSWFDDINDIEDPSIVNPGVAVETCHRVKRSWCVRVSEGGSTPANSPSNIFGFGTRYLEIAQLARLSGNASITTAMITNNAGAHSLSTLCAKDSYFDPTNAASHGYMAGTATNVDLAVNAIVDSLVSSNATLGSYLVGAKAVSGVNDSLTVGTVSSQLTELSAQVNNRVRNPNPNTAAMLTASGPQLIWRSHNVSSNSNVTKDTISWYVSQNTTIGAGGAFLVVCGGYISGSLCYKAPSGTPPTNVSMTMFSTGSTYYFVKTSLTSSWAWDSVLTWEKYAGFGSSLSLHMPLYVTNDNVTLTTSQLRLANADTYIRHTSAATPRRIAALDVSTSPGTTSLPAIWQTNNATYLTQNCYFNSALSRWFLYDSTKDATALAITTDGFTFYRKSHTVPNTENGWPETGVSNVNCYWSTSYTIGKELGSYPYPTTQEVPEIVGAGGELIYFSDSQVIEAGLNLVIALNYRAIRTNDPTASVTILFATNIETSPLPVFTPYAGGYGGYLTIIPNGSVGDTMRVHGYVTLWGHDD